MRIGIRFFLLTLAMLSVLAIAPGASSDVAQTQIVVPGGSGFQTETLDGTVTGSVAVAPGTNAGSYSAAANGSIAYGDSNGLGGVWVVNPNAPPVQVDSSPQDWDVAISPDGSKVAFTRVDPTTEASDIYVVNANGSGLTLVASGGENNALGSPSFSPDGSTIAYTCTVANDATGTGIGCGPTAAGTYVGGGVMLMNVDGSDQRLIVGFLFGNLGESLSWSPDGQSIAVSEVSDQGLGPSEVFVYRTDGSDLLSFGTASRQVTQDPDDTFFPRFALDGIEIIFEKIVDNQWILYTVNADGTGEQALALPFSGRFEVVPPATGGGPSATVQVGQLLPSPDGTVIGPSWIVECRGYLVETAVDAFTTCIPGHGRTGFYSSTSIDASSNDAVVYSDLSAGPGGADGPIWLSRPDAAPLELDSNVNDFEPTISADGSLVTFARDAPAVGDISGGSDIYTIHSDGSDLTLVASGTGTNGMYLSNPTLSPDGSAIAYVCGSIDHSYAENNKFCGPLFDGTSRAGGLMLMNADGSDKRMILTSGIGSDLSWSPDGQWIATAGGCAGCHSQIFAYRTDGSDLFMGAAKNRQVTSETAGGPWDPQFSPDGSKILYQVDLNAYEIDRDGTNRHEVFVAPPDLGITVPGLFVPQKSGPGGPSASVAPTQVPVPDVRRIRFRVARARLAKWRLVAKIVRRRYSAVSWGSVISQSPRQNTYAKLGQNGAPTVVKLVISRGPRPRHSHR